MSQVQDEYLEARTKWDESIFERALPGGPVKIKTSPADQDNCSGWLILKLNDSDAGTVESTLF